MAKKTREELLLEQINDMKSGIPTHRHQPRDGSEGFSCTSPYCQDLGAIAPATSPAGNEDPDKYRRAY